MSHNDSKPNNSSSSEDEETSGSEGEYTSGSDSDETGSPTKTPVRADSNVKPISSVVRNDSKSVKKDGSKMLSTPPLAKSKRPPPPASENHAKKAKQNTVNGESKTQAPDLDSSEPEEFFSGSGSGSGSDTDSDLPPKKPVTLAASNIKHVGSKLVKNDGSKMLSTPSPAKSKRPAPTAPAASEKDSKKVKQNTANGEKKKEVIVASQSANKLQTPDIDSSEAEESGSNTDSDLPPKNPLTIAAPNIKPKPKPISLKSMLRGSDVSKPISTEQSGSGSDTDSGSGSDTDSDLPPKNPLTIAAPNIKPKPISLKSMQRGSDLVKKDVSKPISTEESGSGSDTDSDSGSDADSDLPPKKPLAVTDPSIKPKAISSKKIEVKLVTKDGSKTITTPKQQPPPALKSNGKDGSKTITTPKQQPPTALKSAEKDVKKGAKSAVTEDESKKLFQRLWSEDDEIVVLEGMISYKTERNGENPIVDMGAFHEFIKKSLHVDVSRSQLVDKVRRLKKKYENNAGKDRSFAKSHEQKAYDLSKLIWGSNSGTESKKTQSRKNDKLKGVGSDSGGSLGKSNGVDDKVKIKTEEVEKKIDVSRFVQYGGRNDSLILNEEIVKAAMELVDGSRRAEMEEKWKKLREQELVLYVKRMELLREQALIVLEAIGSAGN